MSPARDILPTIIDSPVEPPLLTVVIPAYNRGAVIGATLASLDGQTCRRFRVVLVDNASDDDTPAVMARWQSRTPLAVTLLHEQRHGAAAARNRGLRAVDTPWVYFFDSDDTMTPRHLDNLLDTAATYPDARIVGCDRIFVDPDGKVLRHKRFVKRNYLYHALFHGLMATQAYMARTDLVRIVGGWDGTLTTWDDLELGLRLLNGLGTHDTIAAAHGWGLRQRLHPDGVNGTTFASRARAIEHTIDTIATRSTPCGASQQAWEKALDVLRGIVGGRYRREGHRDDARRIRRQLHTLAARTAYTLTAAAIPGAARLLRPWLRL